MRIMVVVASALGAGAFLLTVDWLLSTRKTDPRLLGTGSLRRLWRRYRWFWFRIGLNVFAWPHIVDILLGTRKAAVAQTPNKVVWRDGAATLHRYRSTGRGEPVLVVHSLVSQPWILDLAPGGSLIEHLSLEGFDVFLLDWGTPDAEAAGRGLSACSDTLMRAEQEVLRQSNSARLHLVGYCLGGLVCLLRSASRRHAHVASIALLATPVDFSLRVALQPWITSRLFKPVYFLDGSGCVPAEALRESFHILRPRALRTVIAAWARRKDLDFRRRYDPLARWVWEHRPLAGGVFFDQVELFRSNSLLNGTMLCSGELARLEDIGAPILNLIAERDHIVPPASSHALAAVDGIDVNTVEVPSGHVSMVSGDKAKTTTWPAISDWIAGHASGG